MIVCVCIFGHCEKRTGPGYPEIDNLYGSPMKVRLRDYGCPDRASVISFHGSVIRVAPKRSTINPKP